MDYITLIASVPGIVALVNFCKRLGLKGEAPLVAAVVFGVAVNVANFYLAASGLYQTVVAGLMLGLAASGIYDLSPKTSTPE